MNSDLRNLIKQYENEHSFTHVTVSDKSINEFEKKLGVKLPEQYITFLKEYGHGGIAGVEVMGVGLTGRAIFVDETLDARKYGLPQNFVIIENVDEWQNCIDCNTGKIVSWDQSGYIKEENDCFDDYLKEQFEEALENLD